MTDQATSGGHFRLLHPEVLRRVSPERFSATQLFVLSFIGLITTGTLGLLLLPGLYTGPHLGLVDALFTATSAVCVTGLIVVDTATYFTPLGQAWLALLIQLGGLGILTFTTLVALTLGGRARLEVEEAVGEDARALTRTDVRAVLRWVVGVTAFAETVGAAALWLIWRSDLGGAGAVGPAIFHAISAFCNAGFSIFSNSLIGFRRSPVTLAVMAVLIVAGGLGFVVIDDLRRRYLGGSRRLTLHSRLVLASTAFLIVAGTCGYLIFERSHLLGDLSWPHRLANATFMSITARTAGFNTADYNQLSNSSVFLTIILMLIGGSPNSTAGGLKTTTIALLGLALIARLRGEKTVSWGGRSVSEDTVPRAAGVVIGGLLVLALAIFLLLILESGTQYGVDRSLMLRTVFEAHSAFGTVGLSMGATTSTSGTARVLLAILMFTGRVGPPTLVAAMTMAGRRRKLSYRFAREDVLIG